MSETSKKAFLSNNTKPDVKPARKNAKIAPEDPPKKKKKDANPFEKKLTYINATNEELKEL